MGRAVPRPPVSYPGRPGVGHPIYPGRPGYGYPGYGYPYYPAYGYGYPYYGYGYGYGYPYGFSIGFSFGYPWYGYGPAYPAYGYGYGGGYPPYGGVRLDLPQRNAEVYVEGAFVGKVDEFDGTFQQLNLEPGNHQIEIREPGRAPVTLDIRVQPGRTTTYRGDLDKPNQ